MVDLTRRKWTWIGHVLRKGSGNVAKESFVLDTRGKKTTGKAKNNLAKVSGERTQVYAPDLE